MSIGNSNAERRRNRRIDRNIPVKMSCEDFDIVTETQNLSSSGVYCRINKYIEPMTKLKVFLLLPFKKNNRSVTKKVACQGVIVRTEAVPGQTHFQTAVFFNEIHKRDAECISEFVDAVVDNEDQSSENNS